MRTVADSAGEVTTEVLQQNLNAAFSFLTRRLIPHAKAEDNTLYPVIGEILGSPRATATMSRDHTEIGKLTEELASLRSQISAAVSLAQLKALRRILYSLYALIKIHFAKEEEIYLPLLDQNLTADRASTVFTDMERFAGQSRRDETATGQELSSPTGSTSPGRQS